MGKMTEPNQTKHEGQSDKKGTLNKIMQDIINRVQKEKNHRTPTGYSRMHHRHSRT